MGIFSEMMDEITKLRADLAAAREEIKQREERRLLMVQQYEDDGKQLTAHQLVIQQMREAFQTFIDEHEECEDADGWMAFTCSPEALHVADEALALQPNQEALEVYVKEAVEKEREEIISMCSPDDTQHDLFDKIRARKDKQ